MLTAAKVDLVAILHLAFVLDDDVRMRLEQADYFFCCGDVQAFDSTAFGLIKNAFDQ